MRDFEPPHCFHIHEAFYLMTLIACSLTGSMNRSLICISAAVPSGCHTVLHPGPTVHGSHSAPLDRSGTGTHKSPLRLITIFCLV
jgi:hypothetical protein